MWLLGNVQHRQPTGLFSFLSWRGANGLCFCEEYFRPSKQVGSCRDMQWALLGDFVRRACVVGKEMLSDDLRK